MLSLSQFITNAEAGSPIKVRAHNDGYGINIVNANVGGVDVELTTNYYDLGAFHTAKMVLDSYSLRQLIANGAVEAEVGTIGLSKEPVV